MATYKGSIKTSDPRYREGFKIVMPQQSTTKYKSGLTSSELNILKERGLEKLEEQRNQLIKDGSM